MTETRRGGAELERGLASRSSLELESRAAFARASLERFLTPHGLTPAARRRAATSTSPRRARSWSSAQSASAALAWPAPSWIHAMAATAAPPSASHHPSARASRNRPRAVVGAPFTPASRTSSASSAPSTALHAERSSGRLHRRLACAQSLENHTHRAGGMPAARDTSSRHRSVSGRVGRRAMTASVRRSASEREMRLSEVDVDAPSDPRPDEPPDPPADFSRSAFPPADARAARGGRARDTARRARSENAARNDRDDAAWVAVALISPPRRA